MICNKCKKEIEASDAFCQYCGEKNYSALPQNTVQPPVNGPSQGQYVKPAAPAANPPPPKSNKGMIIAVSVCAVILAVLVAVFAVIAINSGNSRKDDRSEKKDYSLNISASKGDKKSDKENNNDASVSEEEKTELVIGYTLFEPYNYYKNDEFVGFDTELAEYVCKELGMDPVFKEIEWDEKEFLLDSGEIDCIWNALAYTNERDDTMSLSDVYLNYYYYDSESASTLCDYLVIGFKKDSELTDRVNEIIDEAKGNGTMDELLQKYIFYRVKLSAEDTDSQLGAFIDFERAKDLADSNYDEGYKVFDAYDNLVYNP